LTKDEVGPGRWREGAKEKGRVKRSKVIRESWLTPFPSQGIPIPDMTCEGLDQKESKHETFEYGEVQNERM
jgi:hypothetical protein